MRLLVTFFFFFKILGTAIKNIWKLVEEKKIIYRLKRTIRIFYRMEI